MDRDTPRIALVADDDDSFRLQLRIGLEHAGFEIIEASSAAEAIDKALETKPDIAIIDLMMEREDAGFLLAWQLKRLDPRMPVIMVTAVTGRTGMDFAAGGGAGQPWVHADAVLTKPIRFEQLEQHIAMLDAPAVG
jgi:two-component system OmpR family response regulator